MTLEKEEQERKELQKMIMGEEDKDGDKRKGTKKDEDESSQFGFGTPGIHEFSVVRSQVISCYCHNVYIIVKWKT